MIKSKTLSTVCGQSVIVMNGRENTSLKKVLLENRRIEWEDFFYPKIEHLHDPFLLPDMEKAVKRIIQAWEKGERIIIFWDYDVDGVSSTAILYRFLSEIGCEVSYRLPHRVHDGYWLKKYLFDELSEKSVKLVITVDCGTRDIEPIKYAHSLGIDVIVTDHHAVPETIPEDVIALINPKRKDSKYPFSWLAGAGVAFKLLHALAIKLLQDSNIEKTVNNKNLKLFASQNDLTVEGIILSYIDLASLGTVADCMPLIDENRIITSLGLRQMKHSKTSALRKFIENLDREVDGDADIIGFQIGPRINAAGRMDSPLKALHWLLSSEQQVDDWLTEVETLNTKRQEIVKKFSEEALLHVDETVPILFYFDKNLEHGIIGLIAGKLTEAYHRPAIVLCEHEQNLVASCRSPEWCNLVELLDDSKKFFVRYGGHRQAAGFTIEKSVFESFKNHIQRRFHEKYGEIHSLPPKNLIVECEVFPNEITFDTLDLVEKFRPFGIWNPKPKFYLDNLTLSKIESIGSSKNHLSFSFLELTGIKCLLWNYKDTLKHDLRVGDIVSPIFTLSKNVWKEKESLQLIIDTFIKIGTNEEKM